jgi:hypothetical protein
MNVNFEGVYIYLYLRCSTVIHGIIEKIQLNMCFSSVYFHLYHYITVIKYLD